MAQYTIGVTFRDEDNKSSSMAFNVDALNEAAAIVRANALAGLLDALSGAAITALGITLNLALTGLQAVPTADIDVPKGLRLIFGTDFGQVNPYVTIPGVLPGIIIPPGVLDPAEVAWDNLFTELFVTGDYQDYRGADLLTLRDNYEVFNGKRRKR